MLEMKTFSGVSKLVITDRVLLDMPDHMRSAMTGMNELQRWIWLCDNPVLQWGNAAEINAPMWKQNLWWWLWGLFRPLAWVLERVDKLAQRLKTESYMK